MGSTSTVRYSIYMYMISANLEKMGWFPWRSIWYRKTIKNGSPGKMRSKSLRSAMVHAYFKHKKSWFPAKNKRPIDVEHAPFVDNVFLGISNEISRSMAGLPCYSSFMLGPAVNSATKKNRPLNFRTDISLRGGNGRGGRPVPNAVRPEPWLTDTWIHANVEVS